MELKEKPKTSKEKDKPPKTSRMDKTSKKIVRPAIPQEQASRMMREKCIRDLKDRPKGKDGEIPQTVEQANEQAAEQVEDSGRWAAGELTGTPGRIARQGREYAKKKAEAAKKEKQKAPVPPADDPAEPPASASPEAIPLDDFNTQPNPQKYVSPKTPFSETATATQSCPETSPKERPSKKHPAVVPKEQQLEDCPTTAPKEQRLREHFAASPKEQPLKEHPVTAPKERMLESHPTAASQTRRIEKHRTPPNVPKERQEIRPKPIQPTEEKPPQSQDIPKPFKERPIDFRIRERSPTAAPKEPGAPTWPAAIVRRDKIKYDEGTSGGTYENKTPAVTSNYGTKRPKTAVPPEYRRALLEKKKASPYAAHDSTRFVPPDASAFMDTSVSTLPSTSAAPSPTSLPQTRCAASMKDILIDKTRKSFKERPRFSQKNIAAEGKPALFLKTRRTSIKPIVRTAQLGPPTAPQRAARAAQRQAQRKMMDKRRKAVRSSVEALRRIAQVIAKTVSTVTGAVTALIGGGILLTALVIVIVIAAVANSPFGLFYAQEPNAPGTVSVAQAVGSVNAAYNARLEELQTGDSYDSIDIQGHAPDWTEVLAVFAVKLAGADIDGLDVATLDPDRVSKLTGVFWDMTAITTEVETIDHPASDDQEAWTEKILHITITPKTADEMRTVYNFTPYQNSALDELLSDRPTLTSLAGSLDITGADERGVLAALPADLELARRQTVENALSLVGKVNYFWGGKSRAIGWDSQWGTLQKVTAPGSRSTGTYRPFGLDCSGMIDWALRNAGLPSDGNWYIGVNLTRVSASEARPGDMALFTDASHIGIVVGRNDAGKLLVCHCSSGRNNVVVTEFSATGFTAVGRPNIFG